MPRYNAAWTDQEYIQAKRLQAWTGQASPTIPSENDVDPGVWHIGVARAHDSTVFIICPDSV